jgi:hypothetical protein
MSGYIICDLLSELLEIVLYEKPNIINITNSSNVVFESLYNIVSLAREFVEEYVNINSYKSLGDTYDKILEEIITFIKKCESSTVVFSYASNKFACRKKDRYIPKIKDANGIITEQFCGTCYAWKLYEYFGTKRTGTKADCVICCRKYHKKYRENPDSAAKIKSKNDRYAESGKQKEVMHARYMRNRDTELKKAADRRANRTADQILANVLYMKNYRASPARKKRAKESLIQFHVKNPLWKKTYMRNYMLRRYFTDPVFRAISKLRRALCKLNKGIISPGSTRKYLGCTIEQYMNHISSLFVNDMSWENEGINWHTDHIIPVAAFDGSEEEKMCCWNYKNLQPLGAVENMAKNSFITRELFESQKHRLIQSVIDRIENGFIDTKCNRIRFMKSKATGHDLPEDEMEEKILDDGYNIEEIDDNQINEIIDDLVTEEELIEDEIENITESMDQTELKEFMSEFDE